MTFQGIDISRDSLFKEFTFQGIHFTGDSLFKAFTFQGIHISRDSLFKGFTFQGIHFWRYQCWRETFWQPFHPPCILPFRTIIHTNFFGWSKNFSCQHRLFIMRHRGLPHHPLVCTCVLSCQKNNAGKAWSYLMLSKGKCNCMYSFCLCIVFQWQYSCCITSPQCLEIDHKISLFSLIFCPKNQFWQTFF